MRSEPGLFLSGRAMPAPGPARLRPMGHVAVCVETKDGSYLRYDPCPEQEALDKALLEERK